MAQDPAILFYTSDFIVGTMTMTDDQVGKYIKLLCLQHQQKGLLSEEDMLKICKSHDKDIFCKFKQREDGFYYNERMNNEINKRVNYSNSRKINRLGKKTPNTSTSHDEHMSNTSTSYVNDMKTHVVHMENENTTINISNTKGNSINNSIDNTNNSSRKDVIDISSTHDEHMLKQKKKVSFEGNWTLSCPVDFCIDFYFTHKAFKIDRDKAFERIKYQLLELPDDEVWDRLKKWAKLFNESIESQTPDRTMRGKDCWPQHFINWLKLKNLKEDPFKIKSIKIDIRSNGATKVIGLSGNDPIEAQQERYKKKDR